MAGPVDLLVGTTAGIAVGTAAADALAPALEPAKQGAWKSHPNKVLDASRLAQLVAQGLTKLDTARERASRTGWNANSLDAMVQLALVAPPVAEVLELWRRNPSRPANEQITEAQVDHALAKAQIEPQYWAPIKELLHGRLDPAVLAVAIQRGIVRDPGFLPVGPPEAQGKVPKFPVSPLDALIEAQASGVDAERLFVETAIVGNPASPDLAARMTFRKIIDKVDYQRAISEGNTRNEWADFLYEGFRQIATAHDGIEGRLRGWLTDAEMYAQTERHGMSRDDTDLLFKINGRPPSWHQVWIGLARGGEYDGPTGMIHPAFLKSLQESNLRPEWYNLLWHSRYNYPSAFVLRQLTTSHTISEADAEQVLLFEGWEPGFAAQVAQAWSGGPTGTASTPTKAYTTAAVKEVSKSYIEGFIDRAAATVSLDKLKVAATDQASLFDIWDITRDVRRRELTATQIAKAVGVTIDYFEGARQLLAESYTQAQVLELLGPAPTDTGQPPVGP